MLALAVERFRSMRNPPEKARTLLISIAPLQYNVPNYSFTGLSVFTNHITGGAFRGYGNTQLTFGREILMDRLAQRLNRPGGVPPDEPCTGGAVLSLREYSCEQ